MEEMQRSTVRQKDASETEGESIQNSDQASNAVRGRNVDKEVVWEEWDKEAVVWEEWNRRR